MILRYTTSSIITLGQNLAPLLPGSSICISDSDPMTCIHCRIESSTDIDHLLRHLKVCPAVIPCSDRSRRPCFACLYIARDAYDLKKHIRKHTNEKPFECLVCDVRFKQISGALHHMKKQHRLEFLKTQEATVEVAVDEGIIFQ